MFHGAFVVINEQARRSEAGQFLFHPVKLNCGGDVIGSAAAKLALVVNWRALRAQVNPGRQRGGQFAGRAVKLVAMVRQIRQPAITGNLVAHGFHCHS